MIDRIYHTEEEYIMVKIYAVIPARKGSKRLTHKNIRCIKDIPLVEYAIIEGQKSKYINEIFVTTDDPEVKRIAKKHGLKIRERPKELATDTTTTQEVMDDFYMWIPFDSKPDFYVLLQPTSPLRTVRDIDRCINMYINGDFDSVMTVSESTPNTYYPNGAVYIFKDKIFTENMGLIVMPKSRSIDIDTEEDFLLATELLEET
jgi:CMP-N-acetylneuraminic acid synthetase